MAVVCSNRRARREYEILETLEAGLVLTGTEVKSVREGRVNIRDAYAEVEGGELYLVNLHISPYEPASHFGHEPTRRRKLLVHRGQLERLGVKIREKGLTLVPLAIYFKGPWAKVEIGLARGKKLYDKRRDMADRESRREVERALRQRQRGHGGGHGGEREARMIIPFLVLALLLVPRLAVGAPAETIEVFWGGNRPPERVEVRREGGDLYVPVGVVARWLGAVKKWDPDHLTLTLRSPGHEIRFSAGNPWVSVDGRLVNLPVPVQMRQGGMEVPMTFLRETAPALLMDKVHWDPDTGSLRFYSAGVNVLGLEMTASPGGVLEVQISLADPLEFVLDSTRPGELRLRLEEGVIDEAQASRWPALLPVRSIRVANDLRYAEIIFEMAAEGGTATAVPMAGGRGLLLTLTGFIPEEIPEPELLAPRGIPPRGEARRKRGAGPLVVIDPGHGGTERGAVGPSGFLEKKANLEIALQLKRSLESGRVSRVLLTRESDQLVPLTRRAEMANLFGADLFVSIHCNALSGSEAGGFEVLIAAVPGGHSGRSSAVEEEDLAKPEAEGGSRDNESASGLSRGGVTQPSGGDQEHGLEVLPWDLAPQARAGQSRALAALVREELRGLGLRDRGTRRGKLAVLTGVTAPAVLVETAFISDPDEERLLQDAGFRREVARALAGAIQRFVAGSAGPPRDR